MQFIFFLLSLFAIGCVLYGLAAGVQTVQRGVAWVARGGRNDGPAGAQPVPGGMATETVVPAPVVSVPKATSQTPGSLPVQQGIGQLRELFALYRQGALTREEFEGMKRAMLSQITPPADKGNATLPQS